MSREAHELLEKALTLSENERAELAGNLIYSLDPAAEEEGVDAAWQQEVVRRQAELRSGKVKSVPWTEVRHKGHTLLHGK
jgi:putative addiction module component (TIGR02574 family)